MFAEPAAPRTLCLRCETKIQLQILSINRSCRVLPLEESIGRVVLCCDAGTIWDLCCRPAGIGIGSAPRWRNGYALRAHQQVRVGVGPGQKPRPRRRTCDLPSLPRWSRPFKERRASAELLSCCVPCFAFPPLPGSPSLFVAFREGGLSLATAAAEMPRSAHCRPQPLPWNPPIPVECRSVCYSCDLQVPSSGSCWLFLFPAGMQIQSQLPSWVRLFWHTHRCYMEQ